MARACVTEESLLTSLSRIRRWETTVYLLLFSCRVAIRCATSCFPTTYSLTQQQPLFADWGLRTSRNWSRSQTEYKRRISVPHSGQTRESSSSGIITRTS